MKKILLAISLYFFLFSSCDRRTDQSIILGQSFTIPVADIVFNTISEPEKGETLGKDILGFYTFKDHSVTLVELPNGYSPIKPYYLDSETIIVLNKMGNFGLVNEGRAYLSILSNAKFLNCYELVGDAVPEFGSILFYSYMKGISIIDYRDCSVEKYLLNSNDLSTLKEYGIGIRSFSTNGDYFLCSKDFHLYKISLRNKEIYDYEREGFSPALSPNQKMIAYLAFDGIHIMDVNGDNDTLIVPYDSFITYTDGSTEIKMNTPYPNWSSDSTKIVYHKCMLQNANCHDIKDFGIFVFNLQNMSEEMLVTGGLNPSWNYFK